MNKLNDLLDLKDVYEHILYKRTSQVSLHIIKNKDNSFTLTHLNNDDKNCRSLEQLFKALNENEYLFDNNKIEVELHNTCYTDDEELSIYVKIIEIYNKRLMKGLK